MRLPRHWLWGLVLLAPAAARAQEPGSRPDPVDQLGRALRAPLRGVVARDAQLGMAVGRLRTADDLRRALLLTEWRDRDQDENIAAVDTRHRAAVAARFGQALRAALRQDDLDGRIKALKLLGRLDGTARGAGEA